MNNDNTTTQDTTFWKFLTDNTIEIPIIQRDYAQGRLGKEYLRKSFLADIKEALDKGIRKETESKMKLDFVYGSVENGKLSPLDGQQRMTTLWLLHWYIALMSGNLNEEVCKKLARFTYKTRISSREFCENLCRSDNFSTFKDFKPKEERRIVDYITSRTWFYSAWKQDPTIQSMLRMIGGTEINDKTGDDIVDGLEEIFKDADFGMYWECLTYDDAPIVFYQLPLENFGLSDDLYIKMNARGKQLTSFENFKADLVRYIREQAKDNQDWNDLLDAKNGIPIKMDTTWTDIFWKNKSKDNKIDEIYFAFLNRFFFNELICRKDKKEYLIKADDAEKNPMFTYLYGNKGDDTNIEYVGLEKYIPKESSLPIIYFDNLSKSLDGLRNVDIPMQSFIPEWVDKGLLYIPQYEGKSISSLGQKERIVFLAVSRYFQSGNYDETSFKQWMRVVWNIVENGGVNTISAMIGVMRLIDELSQHSHNIYAFLADDNNISQKAAQEQIREERAKAKQILKKTHSEEDIIYAEKHPLFKGCISAIFENDDCGRVSFGQSIQDRIKLLDSLWNEENGNDYTLVKVLISLYDKEEPNGKLFLKKNQENWKNLLTDKLKDCFRKIKNKDDIGDCIGWKFMLAHTNLIENSRDSGKIVSNYRDGKIVLWATGGCTWNAYGNVILDDFHKNMILAEMTKNKTIKCNQKINDCDFFWGWDVKFKYPKEGRNFEFEWNTDEHVYLIEKNEKRKKVDGTNYCVSVEGIENVNAFEKKLKELIKEVSQNEQ